MTFLMLNNDIQQNENRIALLRERLFVQLENEKQLLKNKFAENLRAHTLQITAVEDAKGKLGKLRTQRLSSIEQQHNVIATAKNKINLYRDTKTLNLAVRSLSPVGTGKSLILALAGMLGLMGGIMLAFIQRIIS